MTNSASTNTTSTKPFMRRMERRLVGMVMIVIAYLIERAMVRSIRRSGAKAS